MDVQEPAPDSEAVGEGDAEQQPVAGETTSEQIQAEEKPTEEVTTEVETEESEVETYTLPEDARKAKKDFEIIVQMKLVLYFDLHTLFFHLPD